MKMTAKKAMARNLYLNGSMTQKEISDHVEVSERSLSKWVNDGNWKEHRHSYKRSADQMVINLRKQINHILEQAENREDKVTTAGEADQIAKYNKIIRETTNSVGVDEMIQVFTRFNKYAVKHDVELAQDINRLQDQFINATLSEQ